MKNFAKPTLVLITGLLVGAMLLIASPAFSQVAGSRHDLTTGGSGPSSVAAADTQEVCVFCHSPHGVPGQPLWNRGASTATYIMYDSSWSSTIDMVVAAGPQGVSASCLTCHDGTLAYDNLINGTTTVEGSPNYNAAGATQGWTWTGPADMSTTGAPVLLGTDLTDDHPISITYDPTLDSDFNTLASVQGALRLYNSPSSTEDQVECGTCHDPHDRTNTPFLRMDNAGSNMCLVCHTK